MSRITSLVAVALLIMNSDTSPSPRQNEGKKVSDQQLYELILQDVRNNEVLPMLISPDQLTPSLRNSKEMVYREDERSPKILAASSVTLTFTTYEVNIFGVSRTFYYAMLKVRSLDVNPFVVDATPVRDIIPK